LAEATGDGADLVERLGEVASSVATALVAEHPAASVSTTSASVMRLIIVPPWCGGVGPARP
jgi:hypothetical protein